MKTHTPNYAFSGLILGDSPIRFQSWNYLALVFEQDEIDPRTAMMLRLNMPRWCSLDKTIAGHTQDVVYGAVAAEAFDRLGKILAAES